MGWPEYTDDDRPEKREKSVKNEAWIGLLEKLKAQPFDWTKARPPGERRPLQDHEIDGLIAILSGIRPAYRPEMPTRFGFGNARACNQTALAELVFSFVLNRQHLDKTKAALVAETDKEERAYLVGKIETLTPISASSRREAERMAAEWCKVRGVKWNDDGTPPTAKQIQTELNALREQAGRQSLDLDDWLEIKLTS